MASASDLDLGHFCLTAASPAERFDAAARAGFTGISVFWGEVRAGREAQGGVAHFRRALADAGLRPALMEYIPLPRGEQIRAFAAEARDIAETSAELGCEPGDGAFDLARFVRTLAMVAPDVPLMAEVVNDELLGLPAAQAAQMIAARTRPLRDIALGAAEASGN
jgi:sugar phosphate isomerase/epimerase